MIVRPLLRGMLQIYKRNRCVLFPAINLFASTNKYNNKMEETNQLAAKVEQVTIAEEKVEQPPAAQVKEAPEVKVEGKKEKKPKVEKPKAEKKEEPAEDKDEVGPKLFSQIDIRVSEIVECWKHPASENLYCEKINVCGEVREIASGLQKFVPLEQMSGRVLVMANLKPRALAGFNSNGMVVCASNNDHTVVELLIPEGELGERVYLQGFEELFSQGQLQPVLNPKKKIVEKCLQHFTTDEEGYVTWKGIRVRTKAALIKAATVRNGHVA